MSLRRTAALLVCAGCAAGDKRFPLRDPLWQDTDVASVRVPCRVVDKHRTCAPEPYDATLFWDASDNLVFRPLSEALGVVVSHESVNVNAFDEVPSSSWFQNRIGMHPLTPAELERNACTDAQLLDPDHTSPGSWVVDKGKGTGSTPGFRIKVPGKGKYLVKVEGVGAPERQVAATVIGEAVFWAAGYNASCEQALWVDPRIFKLTPGLKAKRGNFGDEYDFDQAALDDMLAKSTHRGKLVRISASAWIPGYGLGQFRWEGTRDDDPNDVIAHEDRRDLRGLRLIAAWLDHFDMREGNSFDTWLADDPKGAADASPGHVVHYQIGTSAALGSSWDWVGTNSDWNEISRRLGYSYLLDWGYLAADFVTLGIPVRPWERARPTSGHELFGTMDVAHFDPEGWKNEYPNKAFSRMSERDGAWMARILAHFTPDLVQTLSRMARLTDPGQTAYLASVLEGRLERILARYLTRASPISALRVEGDELCGVDLADWRAVREGGAFHYTAKVWGGGPLAVTRGAGGAICVALPHTADYLRVVLDDGVAEGKLVAHLYDVRGGFKLVGIERPL